MPIKPVRHTCTKNCHLKSNFSWASSISSGDPTRGGKSPYPRGKVTPPAGEEHCPRVLDLTAYYNHLTRF